jgi:4-amino-4-deoxy-L-arabinose transferase-like glycosyltransferase
LPTQSNRIPDAEAGTGRDADPGPTEGSADAAGAIGGPAAPEAGPEGRAGAPGDSTTWAGRHFAAVLSGIVAVGFAVRMAFILVRQSKAPLTGGDAYWYHFQAKLVADGQGFLHPFEYFKEGRSVPGADHPPGMTVILAVADKLGLGSAQSQRILMSVMGMVSVALIAYVGRRLAGPAVGLVAAGLAAIYPNIWINDGMLMAETPFVLGIVVMLLCAYRLFDRPTWGDVAGLSAGVTLAALTRPEAVLIFPFFVLPLVLTRRSEPLGRRFGLLAVAALVPIAAFGPWLAYNMTRFDEPVLISTGAGQTFVVANCDLTYGGRNLGYWDRKCLFPPHTPETDEQDLSKRDQAYQRQALDYMKDHVGEIPKVVVARIGRMWGVFRPDESIVDDAYIEGRAGGEPGTGFGLVREALWSYFVLLVLAVPGAVLLVRRRVPISPLLVAPVLATVTAAITFGITRYRAGAEVSIVLLAAVSLVALSHWLFGARRERSAADGPAQADGSSGAGGGTAPSGA